MNDDQCNEIVDAIDRLTNATLELKEVVENKEGYSDYSLVKQVNIVAQVLEDIEDKL